MGCLKLDYYEQEPVHRCVTKPSGEAKVVQLWLSVDPLAELAPNKTPYHFASNNPINRVDPRGLTDYKVNGETHTIDDGHNDVSMKVSQREFNRLQKKFDKGGARYENYMNKLSTQNGFTTTGTYADSEGTGGVGVSITQHKAGGSSYAEYSTKNSIVDAVDKTNNYYGGWEGGFATNAYKRAVVATALSAQLDGNTSVVNQMEGLSKSFKYSSKIAKAGPWISGAVGAYNTIQGYQHDGGTIGYNTQRAALGSGLSIVAGGYGATYGASIGAGIGVWFGGVGAVPGAIIGGVIGGIGGGMIGQSAGETIIDEVHK